MRLLAFSCLLALLAVPASAQDEYEPLPNGTINFAEHIASIVFRKCGRCHGENPSAPFSLTDYRSLRERGRVIGIVTNNGSMPPALAEPGYGDLANSGRLSAREIGLIDQWIKEGSPEGDPAAIPPFPQPTGEWKLGKPDLVLNAGSFTVPADAYLLTRNFVLPLDLESPRWLKAIALHRHSPAYLRVLLFVDAEGRTANAAADDANAVAVDRAELRFSPDPAFGAQIMMTRPWELPDGTAQLLVPGTSLVLQTHFQATGVEEEIEPEVGLYFTEEPTKKLVTLSLGTKDLDLPAGEAAFHVRSSFTLPVALSAVGILPNTHLIGSELKAWATLPDGTEEGLVWIKDWDFNYQKQYWFNASLALPAGTTIEMDFKYDNSADNFNNPNYPPEDVAWGLGMDAEVAGLNVQVVVESDDDLAKLNETYAAYRQ